jgi:hypothetical protein
MHYAMKAMEEWMHRSTFLHLGISWKWVVSFIPRPLYPRGKSPRYPFDRLCGPQGRSGDDVEKRKFLTLPGLELREREREREQICFK